MKRKKLKLTLANQKFFIDNILRSLEDDVKQGVLEEDFKSD